MSGEIVKSKSGAEPEKFVISCSVSYRGNISPDMEWSQFGSNQSLDIGPLYKDCNVTTYSLTLLADQITDGVSFVCRILSSGKADYNCSTEKFKVICE